MKLVILNADNCNPGDLSWAAYTEAFPEIEIYGNTDNDEDCLERIKGAEAILAPETYLSGEILSTVPSLRYIGCLSTGYNMVDTAYCKAHGITVTNIPAYGTEMVSQYAIALLLEICCQVGHHSKAVHEGKWARSGRHMFWDYPIIELAGKTCGIIGFGRIGKQTARTCQALGMKVLYSDTRRSEEEEGPCCRKASNEEIYEKADIIFLHCPLFPETEGMINKETLSRMKDGVILINNARGALVNSEDLAEALKSGKVYAAGLDVVDHEPIPDGHPLLSAPNCFITPHISWVARESRARLMRIGFENLTGFLSGKPQNVVA